MRLRIQQREKLLLSTMENDYLLDDAFELASFIADEMENLYKDADLIEKEYLSDNSYNED